jgi:hypothetical protein
MVPYPHTRPCDSMIGSIGQTLRSKLPIAWIARCSLYEGQRPGKNRQTTPDVLLASLRRGQYNAEQIMGWSRVPNRGEDMGAAGHHHNSLAERNGRLWRCCTTGYWPSKVAGRRLAICNRGSAPAHAPTEGRCGGLKRQEGTGDGSRNARSSGLIGTVVICRNDPSDCP